jgi:hypothetical protein
VNWRSESLRLEKGKVYRVRYVHPGEDVVHQAVLTFNGEVLTHNRAVLVIGKTDTTTLPGNMNILEITEVGLVTSQAVRGKIR